MSSRILIADDSLTIQKVIGITLANSGYELIECLNEESLTQKIKSEQFDLILLDFNLSDTKSGYELSKEVKASLPKAGLIVMLGTFDTVEESKFEESGINDKIVKPFESSKFIKKCKEVLELAQSESFEFKATSPKSINPVEEKSAIDDIDSWVVDAPKIEEKFEPTDLQQEAQTNLDPLSSEIQGWGFETQVNLEEKFNKTFPSVIKDDSANVVEKLQASSEFFIEREVDIEDITEPSFIVPESLNTNLINEIEEDVSAEAFWAVDEVVPVTSEESETIKETHLDEVTADLTDVVSHFKAQKAIELDVSQSVEQEIQFAQKEVHEKVNQVLSAEDIDQIVLKLKSSLLPQIERMVKDYCKETATKVSWEVIPDLAENLIKKELKEISESIH